MCSKIVDSAKLTIADTAIIAADVEIDADVSIGHYAIIGSGVKISAGTKIGAHCVVGDQVVLGKNNILHPFSSIGGHSQSRGGSLEDGGRLVIGDDNVIHEYCTINRGSLTDGKVTIIGNGNILMAYVHVGHDCQLGDNVILVNNTTLAGHVKVGDGAVLGAFTTVRQFSRIGAYSFATESAALSKDVLPYIRVRRSPAIVLGINHIGLTRNGFTEDQVKIITEAYRVIFRRGNTSEESINWLQQHVEEHQCLLPMLDLLLNSEQGIVR